jgi:hypothetical protein
MFKGVTDMFKKPDPKEMVRKWQSTLRAEQRNIERQIRGAPRAACTHAPRCARGSFAWQGAGRPRRAVGVRAFAFDVGVRPRGP